MSGENQENHIFEELLNMPHEPTEKRVHCERCCRPISVCFCLHLPSTPINIRNKLVILQHPNEEKRCLRTAKILELSLPPSKYQVIKGKRFTAKKFPEIGEILANPENSLVLAPGDDACSLTSIDKSRTYNVIIIDGTWSQARSMYSCSPELHTIPKVEINFGKRSDYVIRTQPTEVSLSTVETAALALSYLEGDETILDALNKPLKALCQFQLEHGAAKHRSKEYLILNGLYEKPLNRRIQRGLETNRNIKNFIR